MLERLVVVGLGSIGRRHARVARALVPQISITALRRGACGDPAELDCDDCAITLEDALRRRPQAAVIANPATHHLMAAQAFAEAGVHLLVEKPIAATSDGVEQLIGACRANDGVLLVGYNLRFAPSLQFFAAQIAASRIGQVLSVRAEVGQYLPEWRPDADYRTGVSARQSLGGGVLLELSHEIDYLRWIFGSIDWVSAILRTQSTLEIDVEDTALLTLGFGGAGHAGLVASLCMDFVRRDATRTCTAIGELGTLRWDGGRATVSLYDPARNEWVTLFDTPPVPDETYIGEWQHFLECVEHGTSPLVGGHDGLEVLRIIEAARISSSAGGRITAVQGELRELAS